MKIIGVSLVKNEDVWILKALENVREFVDEHIVIDNGSTDDTREIVSDCPWVRLIDEPDLRKTHRVIEPYIGTDTWIFGIDGDEIYDPIGLRAVREMIEAGTFDDAWHVYGMFLHVTEFDDESALGYMGPPSRYPTKLYNMRNIRSWPSTGLHLFHVHKPVATGRKDKRLSAKAWYECPLQCLHMRFQRRSSIEPDEYVGMRLAGTDVLGARSDASRGGYADKNIRPKYRKGPVQQVNILPFGLEA